MKQPMAQKSSKVIREIDLYLARSLMILRHEYEAATCTAPAASEPRTISDMLKCIAQQSPVNKKYEQTLIARLTPETVCASGSISPIFLKNVKLTLDLRNSYAASGKIKSYDPTTGSAAETGNQADNAEEELEDMITQLTKSGVTLLSSDYLWDPEKIASLSDLKKTLESRVEKKITIHDRINPAESYLHREKKMYIDKQIWISLQILPAIKVTVDKD